MKHKLILIIWLGVSLLLIIGCKDLQDNTTPIVFANKNSKDVVITKDSETKILLKGGNGKYIVNVEDTKIATAKISVDTLKIKALLEGKTYATIISGDSKFEFNINVKYPDISISEKEVNLVPGNVSEYVFITGGGDLAKLELHDPSHIVDIKWNGENGMLQIMPLCEGSAEVVAVSQDTTQKQTLKINVKPNGELTDYGIYETTHSSYYTKGNNVMVVKRRGGDVIISNTTRPYLTKNLGNYYGQYTRIAPIVPTHAGDSVNVTILKGDNGGLPTGTIKMFLENITENTITVRTRGWKMYLPRQ